MANPRPITVEEYKQNRKRCRNVLISLAVIFVQLGFSWWDFCYQRSVKLIPKEYTINVFNTNCRLELWIKPESVSQAEGCVRDIIAELQELHNTINVFAPESELSRLNATADTSPFACSERLWDILLACRAAAEITDGWFDVTVSPLLRIWGISQKQERLPTDEELAAALAKVGMDKVEFLEDGRRIRFKVPGMSLNLGGMAKGYALDLVKPMLEARGISCFALDFGGNIYVPTADAKGAPCYSGIRWPRLDGNRQLLGTLQLSDKFMATSGNYYRGAAVGTKKISHILDPHTGRPAGGLDSVTVATTTGLYSDILSTAIFAAGPEFAAKIATRFPHTTVVILEEQQDEPRVFGELTLLAD